MSVLSPTAGGWGVEETRLLSVVSRCDWISVISKLFSAASQLQSFLTLTQLPPFQVIIRCPSPKLVGNSASKSCLRRFVITEKAPTRAFSWLKAATTAFTFKTLLRHYAKRALTPCNYHKGRAAIRHYAKLTMSTYHGVNARLA